MSAMQRRLNTIRRQHALNQRLSIKRLEIRVPLDLVMHAWYWWAHDVLSLWSRTAGLPNTPEWKEWN